MQASASTLHLDEVTHKTAGIARSCGQGVGEVFWIGAFPDATAVGIHSWWYGLETPHGRLQQTCSRVLADGGLR